MNTTIIIKRIQTVQVEDEIRLELGGQELAELLEESNAEQVWKLATSKPHTHSIVDVSPPTTSVEWILDNSLAGVG
jgi:hypothetical protein